MIAKTTEIAIQKALLDVGLNDKEAGQDVKDLRSFIGSIRFARRTAFRAAIQKIVDLIVYGGVMVLAMKYVPGLGSHTDGIPPAG